MALAIERESQNTLKFRYYDQGSLPENIKISITVHSLRCPDVDGTEFFAEVYLILSEKLTYMGLPMMTDTYECISHIVQFHDTMVFPNTWSDCLLKSFFAIRIFRRKRDFDSEDDKELIGGTCCSVFDENSCLRMGKQKLKIWHLSEPDPRLTPGRLEELNLLDRLERNIKKYDSGEIQKIEWLDYLVFKKIDQISSKWKLDSNEYYLYLEFPRPNYPIMCSLLPSQSLLLNEDTTQDSMNPPMHTNDNGLFTIRPIDTISDFELNNNNINPIDYKTGKLFRSQRFDKNSRPPPKLRDELDLIIQRPFKPLSMYERDLVWTYRYYLSKDKKALKKFLKSVNWSDPGELKEVHRLLATWSVIDITDALDLLSFEWHMQKSIQQYAFRRVQEAKTDEIIPLLFPLVQTLRYPTEFRQDLSLYLFELSKTNFKVANDLYWYFSAEEHVFGEIKQNYLEWLEKNNPTFKRILNEQHQIINTIFDLASTIGLSKDSRPKKIMHLRQNISNLLLDKFHRPIPVPLEPNLQSIGLQAHSSSVFKSSLNPLFICFKTETDLLYQTIFKVGDDLRQDQLVMQLIVLMDQILKRENLDLKLKTYKILSTGNRQGMLEYVSSQTISAILSGEHKSILGFLQHHAPSMEDPHGVSKDIMENFVRSCAGYCVITYILGIGDRHLENLMLTDSGQFFHIDFGFVFGRDPKPFSPTMKVSQDMVNGMGGQSSVYFTDFLSYSLTAFIILRKHSNLIISILNLMKHSNIMDLSVDPERAINGIEDRFCLSLSDQEAAKYLLQLINENIHAILPSLIDRAHGIAQFFRS